MIALAVKVGVLALICMMAYNIRTKAIDEYGLVIHEFDPWFNFRATQYLADNGSERFFKWFDYMSWYPLGRPVGTTIYPGMQFWAVWIWRGLNGMGYEISLNDVCCYIPCWFGVSATLFLGLLTYECTASTNAGILSSAIMAIVPAHIMRSVGGGYDNESVAMTALCSTFYFWCRSIRTEQSWPVGVLAGLAYFNMVAAWGGYVFVLNMIGLHAAVATAIKVVKGEEITSLHRAYSLFFVIGTSLAIQIPVVGLTPLKSLEQMMPLLVFLGLQLLEVCEVIRRQQKLDIKGMRKVQLKVAAGAVALAMLLVFALLPSGYFGPLSSRVRGLFVQHTKTGNPLVDSVAEHQPASAQAYYQNLHVVYYLAPIGFVIMLTMLKQRTASLFLVLYMMVAYYFSSKMARLIILLGPIASSLGGVAVEFLGSWAVNQASNELLKEEEEGGTAADDSKGKGKGQDESSSKKSHKKDKKKDKKPAKPKGPFEELKAVYQDSKQGRVGLAMLILLVGPLAAFSFFFYSDRLAGHMSHPSIMFKARLGDGSVIMIDDYREAYWWLRDNTPQDSRVMAWWDYGYQITGIANRTTIADGNTWNHEHIATLARCLVSPEARAHSMIKHLADYVLIWTGGNGDDLDKSIHLARIGNSVYSGLCGDAVCSDFARTKDGATPRMADSLIYKMHGHGEKEGVSIDTKLWTPVYTSKYRKVKIYKVKKVNKKSRKWSAEPSNRKCDAPGSWYCTGDYPPKFQKFIKDKKDFAQIENFNVKKDAAAQRYQEEYMSKVMGGK
mmetsp:Transcript_24377/g.47951  ORF Transcript_24377/g.47951 Transcript_24377/m.47951 type:complete len:781 (+) Transcript_24377:52-2394(+)